MTERINTEEMLDKLDSLLPGLVMMKDRLDEIITDIKLFKATKLTGSTRAKVTVATNTIEGYFDVKMRDLRGKSREGDVMRARHIFHTLVKSITELSYARIGDYTAKDHATVMNSCRVLNNARDTGDALWEHYRRIERDVSRTLNEII